MRAGGLVAISVVLRVTLITVSTQTTQNTETNSCGTNAKSLRSCIFSNWLFDVKINEALDMYLYYFIY